MFRSAALTLTLSLATFTAQASLLGRAALTPGGTDYQAYYDTDLSITWLADTNYAATNSFGVTTTSNGGPASMNVANANAWIDQLNAVGHLGANGWRLPSTLQPDPHCGEQGSINRLSYSAGYYCDGGELGHMFYAELGGVGGQPISVEHGVSYSLFANVDSSGFYWSATHFPCCDLDYVWAFGFNYGQQNFVPTEFFFGHAWAVHDGDPFAVVPLAPAVWLFGSALGLMGVMRREISS